MFVVLALFLWFALSVPATVFIGRLIAVNSLARDLPYSAQVATSGHHLIRG